MSDPRGWRGISVEDRRLVVDLLTSGQKHPDEEIARRVFEAAQYALSRPTERLPGWLLPAVSIVCAVLTVVGGSMLDQPVLFVLAGFFIIPLAMGLVGWNVRRFNKRVVRLYDPLR